MASSVLRRDSLRFGRLSRRWPPARREEQGGEGCLGGAPRHEPLGPKCCLLALLPSLSSHMGSPHRRRGRPAVRPHALAHVSPLRAPSSHQPWPHPATSCKADPDFRLHGPRLPAQGKGVQVPPRWLGCRLQLTLAIIARDQRRPQGLLMLPTGSHRLPQAPTGSHRLPQARRKWTLNTAVKGAARPCHPCRCASIAPWPAESGNVRFESSTAGLCALADDEEARPPLCSLCMREPGSSFTPRLSVSQRPTLPASPWAR